LITREKILKHMQHKTYRPLTVEELAAALEVEDMEAFLRQLARLEQDGAVILTRKGKYGLPEMMGLVVGRVQAHAKGFAFVINDRAGEPDVFVSHDDLAGAMHNDRVILRIARQGGEGSKPEGEVIRILYRANQRVVGTLEKGQALAVVVPDDSRLKHDILIPPDSMGGARPKDKVVVEITRWPEQRRSPEGKVVEVLGRRGEPGVDVLSIVRKHQLPEAFDKRTLKEAEAVPGEVQAEDLVGRRDLRDLPMVTIDGEDAKDLDDAVSIQPLPGGLHRLGVHIADVAFYVKEGSKLDREALARGTSVYLVDRVIPMLPHHLSNGICSLNAGVDRLAISVLMDVNQQGQVINYEIFPSVIRVKERMTYTAVRQILADRDPVLMERYRDYLEIFNQMEFLCHVLRQKRLARGAIDFDFPEFKVKLAPDGKPTEIVRRSRTIAEQIIEEFMILANETVAGYMHQRGVPCLYRVHEEPSEDSLQQLNEFLHTLGYHVKVGRRVQPRAFQEVLQKVAGRPEEKVVGMVMLRSMKHARYDAECLGHFGLASAQYLHFTSPIRRYPDLIVHRMLREVLAKGRINPKRLAKLETLMPEWGEQCSLRERVAEEAERETVDLKMVEYMTRHIGETFPAIISGVTSFGFFAELPKGVEGLVHVSTLTDDYYHYHEKQLMLVGQHSGRTFKLGGQVEVQVVRADVENRQIDLELAGERGAGAGNTLLPSFLKYEKEKPVTQKVKGNGRRKKRGNGVKRASSR